MAEAQLHLIVAFIQAFDTLSTQSIALVFPVFWLTAATDTTAGTSHYFDKMIAFFTTFDLFDQLTDIGRAVNDSDLYFQPVDVDTGFLDTFQPAYRLQVVQGCRSSFLVTKV